MNWAAQKRLRYFMVLGILILAAVSAVAVPIINRPPSCTDKKQNGGESGIDCGGGCEKLCLSDIVPIEVLWSRALPSGPKRVNLIAYVQNSNKTAGVAGASYKFTVYDNKGGIIQTLEGTTDLPANSATAIFAGPIDIGERKVQSTTLEWKSIFVYKTQSDKALDSIIKVVDTQIERATTTTSLSANLRNLTRGVYKNVPVVAIIYDKDENAVLASRTVLDELASEEAETAVFFWNVAPPEVVSRIEVLPVVSEFIK